MRMSDRPRPGGYKDRAALARGRSGVSAARRLVRQLVEDWDRMGRAERLLKLAGLGVRLAEVCEALGEMELIRERWVNERKAGSTLE